MPKNRKKPYLHLKGPQVTIYVNGRVIWVKKAGLRQAVDADDKKYFADSAGHWTTEDDDPTMQAVRLFGHKVEGKPLQFRTGLDDNTYQFQPQEDGKLKWVKVVGPQTVNSLSPNDRSGRGIHGSVPGR